ncbi:MAG: FAD-binding oxidoreductase, partial [Bacteroidales bacterium]|nr:FAD-binding oxidoreductase [Bacteroidales bacterium]
MKSRLAELANQLEGELFDDEVTRILYATDASVYCEMPLAVAYPRNEADLIRLVEFAKSNQISLIPRTAGTSLAGQVVGSGIVLDVSRHMTRILEFNPDENYIWVEPGVILDELNAFLAPSGLFFGPETSTGNRCMIGGMVGNNACGLHSVIYGSTREHTLAIRAVLSDASVALFEAIDDAAIQEK